MKRVLAGLLLALGCISMLSTAWAGPQRGQNDSRTLSGRVFSSHDEPLQKAIVYLKNTKTLAIKTYITDPDGSYWFSGLVANVDYEVYAELQGVRSDTKILSGFDSRKQATITLRIKGK